MEIREIDLSDSMMLDKVSFFISEHSWGHDYPVKPSEEHEKAEYCVGVYNNDELVGIGIINRFSSPDGKDNGELWLADAVVLPEFRGRGIYRKLYDTRMQYALQQPRRILSCTDNPIMEKFFLKNGWFLLRETLDEEGGRCLVFEYKK